MSEKMKMGDNGRSTPASIDVTVNILQAMFKHYFEMAMDHHTKAATTSNILVIIVGAIISFAISDDDIGGIIDFVSGLTVFILGLFGAAWSLKQFERYTLWQHIAHQYQKELTKFVPELKTEDVYRPGAKDTALKKYPSLAKIHERWLWASVHGIVAAIGLGLMVLAA